MISNEKINVVEDKNISLEKGNVQLREKQSDDKKYESRNDMYPLYWTYTLSGKEGTYHNRLRFSDILSLCVY